MRCTDACVFPLPEGDSSPRRMALEARELGFDSLVAAGAAGDVFFGVEIVGAVILQGKDIKEVQAAARKVDTERVMLMVRAGDYLFNRALMHTGGIRVIREIQSTPRNSFDHILSKMAAERRIAIDLDLSVLVAGRDYVRQKALERYAAVVRLEERFGFPLTLSSGARSVLGMKSRWDMVALCRLFGMDEERVDCAFGSVARLLHPERPVEVVE